MLLVPKYSLLNLNILRVYLQKKNNNLNQSNALDSIAHS